MPTMPRPEGKAKKIAYAILGEPQNLIVKRTKKRSEINRILVYEETFRVR